MAIRRLREDNLYTRYTLINPGSNQDPMYQQIDVSNPFIITYRNASRAGEWINKAGISTGWTQGQISATCKDVEYWVLVTMSPNVIQCQHEASYGHANGDSGSPVFALVGDAADLRGIHWGYYPQMTGMKIVFSPLGRIEQDFGTLLGLGESGGGGGGSGECDPEAKECF